MLLNLRPFPFLSCILWLLLPCFSAPLQAQRPGPPTVLTGKRSVGAQGELLKKCAVIFVHGFLGNEDTWRTPELERSTGLPGLVRRDAEFLDCDVFNLNFGITLGQSTGSIEELGEGARRALNDAAIHEYHSIYFVAHSLGGLVVRQLLINETAERPEKPLLVPKTKFIVVFGTPGLGARIASVGSAILTRHPFLEQMRLAQDGDGWVVKQMKAWTQEPRLVAIPQQGVFEEKKTAGILIVPPESAMFLTNQPRLSVDADHLGMVKPLKTGDGPHKILREVFAGFRRRNQAAFLPPDQVPILLFDSWKDDRVGQIALLTQALNKNSLRVYPSPIFYDEWESQCADLASRNYKGIVVHLTALDKGKGKSDANDEDKVSTDAARARLLAGLMKTQATPTPPRIVIFSRAFRNYDGEGDANAADSKSRAYLQELLLKSIVVSAKEKPVLEAEIAKFLAGVRLVTLKPKLTEPELAAFNRDVTERLK